MERLVCFVSFFYFSQTGHKQLSTRSHSHTLSLFPFTPLFLIHFFVPSSTAKKHPMRPTRCSLCLCLRLRLFASSLFSLSTRVTLQWHEREPCNRSARGGGKSARNAKRHMTAHCLVIQLINEVAQEECVHKEAERERERTHTHTLTLTATERGERKDFIFSASGCTERLTSGPGE